VAITGQTTFDLLNLNTRSLGGLGMTVSFRFVLF